MSQSQELSSQSKVAKRIAIGDLKSSSGRVNVIGIVIRSGNHMILDDTTGQIALNGGSGRQYETGDSIMAIGSVNESYLMANVTKKIDPAWIKVRKLELKNVPVPQNTPKQAPVPKESENENALDYILSLVKKLDEGRGVSMEEIVQKAMIKEGKEIIENLMSRGDIFEIEPGKIKVLE